MPSGTYTDPQTVHNPATGTSPPATWGDTVRDDLQYLHARGPYVCTSGTRPSGPTEGDTIYETDTDKMMTFDGSNWWTIAIPSTASTSFTSTISQGVSTNISKSTNYSQYRIISGVCEWWFAFTMSASGTAGSQVTLTLPVTSLISTVGVTVGNGMIYDSSVPTIDTGHYEIVTSTTVSMAVSEGTNAPWGASPNIALASGDIIRGHIRFLVASAA